jgi:hypothetical protein
MLVAVRHRKTGHIAYAKSRTWEDGPDIPVWIGPELFTWKQTDTQLVDPLWHPEPPPPPQIPPDPFELYTEQELEDMYESITGYAITKEYILKMLDSLRKFQCTYLPFLSFSQRR